MFAALRGLLTGAGRFARRNPLTVGVGGVTAFAVAHKNELAIAAAVIGVAYIASRRS